MRIGRYIVVCCIAATNIFLIPNTITAQESDAVILEIVDQQQAKESKPKNFRVSLLGGPGYTPDYGFLVGGSALMTFNLPGTEGAESRSVVPLSFSVSFGQKIGWSLLLRPQLFIKEDKIRLSGDYNYSNLSSNYYGVGFERNKDIVRGGSTTSYLLSQVKLNPLLLFRVKESNWFLGTTFHFQYDKITDPAKDMVADRDYIAVGGDEAGYKTFNNGVGFAFSYDTRDITSNAYRGIYFDVRALTFSRYYGGNFNYQQLQIKYRQYFQLSKRKQGRTLALNLSTENIFGNAPFIRLPLLGSPFDLRGYFQGQYRDKSAHIAMAEYRHDFSTEKRTFMEKVADRLGFVTWMGAGLLGPAPFDIEGVLPNFGAGLRVEVQPRMNVRLDVGYSPIEKQTLFYLNMTEAF